MKSNSLGTPRSLLFPIIFVSLLAILWSTYARFWILSSSSSDYVCGQQTYTTEIISVDPLVIYIDDFVSSDEAKGLIEIGTPNLTPSLLTHPKTPHNSHDPSTRTSSSGALPPSSPLVSCILSRSSSFLGRLIPPPPPSSLSTSQNPFISEEQYLKEIFGLPQMVKYEKGQKFDIHHDWFDEPQFLKSPSFLDPKRKRYNRVASFFVYLSAPSANTSHASLSDPGGETYFPYIHPPSSQSAHGVKQREKEEGKGKWREHEDGGISFRAIEGNAVFWVNLDAGGKGDERVVHAGLPVAEGGKVAMNIWPRMFF